MTGKLSTTPTPNEELLARVYDELHKMAQRQMAGERAGHTLQATALVHEAFLRLQDEIGGVRDNPGSFFLAASEAMRHILIDHARRYNASKRGGNLERVSLDLSEVVDHANLEQILLIDDAIRRLEDLSPRTAKVVHLRFFAGLSVTETVQALGLSERTVRREWTFARAWLYHALKEVGGA